jgi:CBS domain-containing protein
MVEEEISSLVVQDEEGCLEGIVTRMEILGTYLALETWASELVGDHMTRDALVVSPHTMLLDAAKLMSEHRVSQVVVALAEGEKQRPVALLSDADLAYHLVKGS